MLVNVFWFLKKLYHFLRQLTVILFLKFSKVLIILKITNYNYEIFKTSVIEIKK